MPLSSKIRKVLRGSQAARRLRFPAAPWAASAVILAGLVSACSAVGELGSQSSGDAVTDFADPPPFRAVAEARQAAGASVAYAGGTATDSQRYSHPEIKPLTLVVAPQEAYAAALDLVRERGWEVVDATPPGREPGRVEAVVRTTMGRHAADVVIRVGSHGIGSRIDMRSASRAGRGTLGANARRVAALLFDLRNVALQRRAAGPSNG
jgi:uncharacterized protein (DUF1499 family)